MFPEYRYTSTTGWTLLPTDDALLTHALDEDAGAALFAHGYMSLAESGRGRCGVGSFTVWQAKTAVPGWPRYCIEIEQVDDACVVWMATLPDLWEFLRRYGGIGYTMSHLHPEDLADHDEDEEEEGAEAFPICDACRADLAAGDACDPLWDDVEDRGPHDDA